MSIVYKNVFALLFLLVCHREIAIGRRSIAIMIVARQTTTVTPDDDSNDDDEGDGARARANADRALNYAHFLAHTRIQSTPHDRCDRRCCAV